MRRTSEANPAKAECWHSKSIEQALVSVDSSPKGLTQSEAERGNWLQIVWSQFRSVIIWILIAAGIVSLVLGEKLDAIAIFLIIVLNAAIGFYQEYNAEKSITALQKMTAPMAKVLRGSETTLVPAAKIVTGDILVLEAGDIVAADARLLQAASLSCMEATLTGESDLVVKRAKTILHAGTALGDRENIVFMGTSIAVGKGEAVVVSTGMATELGHIAGLIKTAAKDEGTPLQRKLDSVGRVLVGAALGIVGLLFVLGVYRGEKPVEMLMTSISLAVAAVPEGLPAVVTVALSLGVARMAKRHALVRKLAAVETLGSTSVICTDKTGTLTVGQMTVRAAYVDDIQYDVTGEGYGPEGEVSRVDTRAKVQDDLPLLELATIVLACNNANLVHSDGAWKTEGDPTEGALLTFGLKAGVDRQRIESDFPKLLEFPFDSDRKRSTVIRHISKAGLRAFINGAPGTLLKQCTHIHTSAGIRPLMPEDRERILGQTSKLAKQALRVLGSAYRDLDPGTPLEVSADSVEHDLVFVGLTGMYDPPRSEAKSAIATCARAGIRVIMITGDHPHTAAAIAHELGITSGTTVTGAEIEKQSDEELRLHAHEVTVYARVTAEHKLRIVRALREDRSVVAMTGDGVNDAPAITGADIGIAMGKSGTEVTKQAADMIITDDNFATIVAAVEEGRGIYDNIRKTLEYLLAGNIGELLLMTTCVVIGLPMPLLPIHLLWINLVTDGLPALCLATDSIDPDVMHRLPRPPSERIANPVFIHTMLLTGFLTAGVAFAVYLEALRVGTAETARTSAFTVLVFAELLRSLGGRSETKPIWRINPLSNLNLVLVVVISCGIQVLSLQNQAVGLLLNVSYLPPVTVAGLLFVGAIPLVTLEIIKSFRLRGLTGK